MKRTLTLLCAATLLSFSLALAQEDSTKQIKVERINPYHSIKSSIFAEQYLFGGNVKTGNAVGFEVRKFTGLRNFVFVSAAVCQFRGQHEDRDSDASQYKVSYNSMRFRVGSTVTKELYNFFVGTHYIFDAHLSESFYSNSQTRRVTATGDITPYIRRISPFFGFMLKVRVLKFLIIEGSYEWHVLKTFKPLNDKWRVPASESPFLKSQKDVLQKIVTVAVHIKL